MFSSSTSFCSWICPRRRGTAYAYGTQGPAHGTAGAADDGTADGSTHAHAGGKLEEPTEQL